MDDPHPKARRVTSIDVAEAAGVSQSTVSRALSGCDSITEATRARVEAAARALDYRVNAHAARLRRGSTGALAVIVIGRAGAAPGAINPFHYKLLGAVCAEASARGLSALVSFQSDPEQFAGGHIESGIADGVVLIGTTTNAAAWAYHADLLDRAHVASWASPFDRSREIRSDNERAARLAVERLVAGGHGTIVFVGTVEGDQPQFAERYRGYCAAMTAAGLPTRLSVPPHAEDRASQGAAAVEALLSGGRDFDGLYFACDALALGGLDALAAAGVAVPGDVGVIGYDGIDGGEHSNPPLTTVEPDFAEAARLLVERAMSDEIEDGAARVPVTVVERASVRAPTCPS